MTNSPPRVSIGMPVYNGQSYLRPALDSILTQTFSDFELIISDNASTDATPAICREYMDRDRRIRYYRNERNLGSARNHNQVVELARGRYFKWAHADDMWAPELLQRCVDVLELCPNVVLCYSVTNVIDQDGMFLRDLRNALDLRAASPVDRYRAFHWRYRHNQVTMTGHIFLGLMRLEALRKTRLHDNIFSADIVLLAELAVLGEFCEVSEPLFHRRVHPESGFNKFTPQAAANYLGDPAKRRVIVLPHWRLAFELARSLASSPLNRYEKLRCLPQLPLWCLRFWKVLAQDVWVAAKQGINVSPRRVGKT